MTAISAGEVFLRSMQGTIHGATVGRLRDRMVEAGAKNQLTTLALQISHIALVSARTFSSVGFLEVIAKVALVLTPLAIGSDLYSTKDVTLFSENTAKILNKVYVGGMIANAIALFILGNPISALAAIAVLGIDAVATGRLQDILNRAKGFGAVATLMLEGADVLVEKGPLSALNALAAVSVTLVGANEILNGMALGANHKKGVVVPETTPPIVEKGPKGVVVPETTPPVVEKGPKELIEEKHGYSRFLELFDFSRFSEPMFR